MFKNKGFTLAEVLITLTIIGVVSALTVPNLYAYYQKQQYVTQLKKVYTEISQAIKLLMADEGINKITLSDTLYCNYDDGCDYDQALQRLGNNFLKKYFKVIKDCGKEDNSRRECFSNNTKTISGGDPSNPASSSSYCIITAGEYSLCLTPATNDSAIYVLTDINGLKNPNISGRDVFAFNIYYDGSVDVVTPECKKGIISSRGLLCGDNGENSFEARQLRFESICLDSIYGVGCFDKILNDNWKMDY